MGQTLDEVISANVQRLREDRGYSVAQLAERLRVGRHAVYDYERPRQREETSHQHSFSWSELVALCAALECSVFELVLPAEGETVDVPEWVAHGDLRALGVELDLENLPDEDAALLGNLDPESVRVESVRVESVDPAEFGVVVVTPPGREELAHVVFHMPADVLTPSKQWAERYEETRDRIREAERQAAREANQNMIEALRSALAELEQEGDEE